LTFDIEKTINYWIESALYDMETGKSLIESCRYPYALFFGHLALEKTLKAIIVRTSEKHAPFTHSLIRLASLTGIDVHEEMLDRLAEYTEFHLESRYPDENKKFYDKCNATFARKKFSEMEDARNWLIQKLEIL
jgi:HEPN domain-containing protein